MAEYRRRAAERRRCYFNARFIFSDGSASMDAVVRNFSPLGARLEADDLSIVPSEFDLLIHSDTTAAIRRPARRVWLCDGAIGVAFVADEGGARLAA